MSLAQRPNPARELTVAAANRLDDLPDCVDHQLRLLLVYFVAAVRIRDVFRVRHQVGELLLFHVVGEFDNPVKRHVADGEEAMVVDVVRRLIAKR